MSYPFVMSETLTLCAGLDGRSLARFGDGELKICRGSNAKSQRHDPYLSAMLCRILRDTSGPCLPCIPRPIADGPKRGFWKEYQKPRWTGLYNPEGQYGSAFITRPDSAPMINGPAYWALVRQVWEGRDVVLVRGSGKSLTPERLPGARSVHEILGPVQHAWAEHKALYAQLRGEKRRVILCLGATATVLAWMLAQEGTHALDLGHVGMFTKRLDSAGIVPPKVVNSKD